MKNRPKLMALIDKVRTEKMADELVIVGNGQVDDIVPVENDHIRRA